MYSIDAYEFITDLLVIQYERLGGVFLPFEHAFLIDAAKSGVRDFVRAIDQMFYSSLETALMGCLDSCLFFLDWPVPVYGSVAVLEGIDLLYELICICCPENSASAQERLNVARRKASRFFSR